MKPLKLRLLETAAFLEALQAADGKPAARYLIRVIRAGLSGNGNYYSDATLREAVSLFAGARVYVKGDAEHQAGQGRDFRNLAGGLTEPRFVEGRQPDTGEIRAILTLLKPGGDEDTKLREAVTRGMTGLFGFSIDARAHAKRVTRGNRSVLEATKFTEIRSVDLIVVPGAGGEVIGLVEAKGTSMDDDEIILSESAAQAICKVEMERFTHAARKRVMEKWRKGESQTEGALREAIADAKTFAVHQDSGTVSGLGDFPRIEPGEDRAQKIAAMMDACLDLDHKNHKHASSIRDCYVAATGDRRVTGHIENCDEALMRESLGASSWANVLGNSITRRLLSDYRRADQYSMWRQVANPVSVNDFRTNERTRVGGYGDLPIVTEGAAYLAQASPTDEKATYTVAKRGGTEDITLEMIRNDDVASIQRVPINLSRAAKRTLSKFVFDMLRTNPTIYDSIAFFHATHGNLFAAALDATQLAAHRLAIMKAVEMNSADRIGVAPTRLVVPLDLEQTAVDLFARNTNNDKTFIQSMTMTIVPVWYWTDTNDWCTLADPLDIPTIEIGFLDGNQEPELFVQDMPNVGSMFANDKLTYKIRHIYGGNVTDFRGATKAVV